MIRLYVTLLKTADASIEYKKLILMIDSELRVSMLKRHIEREFTELFPNERPFICGKVEDQYAYSLSNVSYIRDLLKNDDRIVAVPEAASGSFVNSHDTKELVQLLITMQQSIAVKLANAAVDAHQPLEELLMTVLPLSFVVNRDTMHCTLMILIRAITPATWRLLEDRSNGALVNLLVLGLQYWVFEVMEGDATVQNGLIDLLGVLIRSPTFCRSFKTAMVMNRLMNLTKVLTSEGRAKLVKVINGLSKADGAVGPEEPRAQDMSRGSEGYARMQEPGRMQNMGRMQEVSRGQEMGRMQEVSRGLEQGRGQESRPNDGGRQQEGTRLREAFRPAEVPRYTDPTRRPGSFPRMPNSQSDSVILEYVNMFSSDSNPDMIAFGLQSIDALVDGMRYSDATDIAINDKSVFLIMFNLTEYVVPNEVQHVQVRILRLLTDKITRTRPHSPALHRRDAEGRLHSDSEVVPEAACGGAGRARDDAQALAG